jgi:cell division protein FtsL
MNIKVTKPNKRSPKGDSNPSPRAVMTVWRLLGVSGSTSRGGTFLVATLAAIVLFTGLFYVWSRMRLVQIGYEITELERINNDLKKRKRELKLELASIEAPANLEKRAREEAGLIFPPISRVVHVP